MKSMRYRYGFFVWGGRASALRRWGLLLVMRDENRFILIHISLFDDFVLYRVGMALWRRFFFGVSGV